jgi:putative membrane protein
MSYLDDPRVFFAAERTLLAWTRTSLTLMAFGFVIERFGLFLRMLSPDAAAALARGASFWVGIGFILLGVGVALSSIVQYRRVLATLKAVEIPRGYWTGAAVVTNLLLAVLGIAMTAYLFTT